MVHVIESQTRREKKNTGTIKKTELEEERSYDLVCPLFIRSNRDFEAVGVLGNQWPHIGLITRYSGLAESYSSIYISCIYIALISKNNVVSVKL